MKKSLGLALLLFLACVPFASAQSAASAYDAVDPLIGTAGEGNTFPGATLPFGMVQWSPDTRADGWYKYEDHAIRGFSLTHLSGAGCPLYGDFPFLPWGQAPTASPAAEDAHFEQAFAHTQEQAKPGFYSLTLADGTHVELTVTDRAGIARVSFPKGSHAGILLNTGGSANTDVHVAALPPIGREHDGSSVRVDGGTVYGTVTAGGFCGSRTRYTLHMAMQFNRAPASHIVWKDAALVPEAKEATGQHTGVWIDFGANDAPLLMKVGLSYVSEAGALANLQHEIPAWDMDGVHRAATKTWEDTLARVETEGGTAEQRTLFYTGLYHMLLAPNLFSDVDGAYMGFDEKQHSAGKQAQYANFSDWDIYRNTIQLQALLFPAQTSAMMESLVRDAEQSGWLPKWPAANDVTDVMGGDSPSPVISSAYAFGATEFDAKAALRYMLKGATEQGEGMHGYRERPHLDQYLERGYIASPPDDISASATLEFASADFAVSRMARALGDTAAEQKMLESAGKWHNLFDPKIGLMHTRGSDGNFIAGFDPDHAQPRLKNAPLSTDQEGFQEGNTWHYTFMVPFDYAGLFGAMGGDANAVQKLDRFFSQLHAPWSDPYFNIGNEPDFVAPYAYCFAGAAWKTQEVIPRILKDTFSTRPDGLPGNDDLGATSGMYVWGMLGLYPAIPGVPGLVVSGPHFTKASMHLGDGRTLTLTAPGTGPYITSMTVNGKPYSSTWLPMSSIGKETTLGFGMSPSPNKQWGAGERPPSFAAKK